MIIKRSKCEIVQVIDSQDNTQISSKQKKEAAKKFKDLKNAESKKKLEN